MMRQLLVLVILCWSYIAFSMAADDIKIHLAELIKTEGEIYAQRRADLLAKKPSIELLHLIAQNTSDWKVAIVCESLIYEISKPEEYRLFKTAWQRPGSGAFSNIQRIDTTNLLLQGGYFNYTHNVILAFGIEAFALIAEDILLLHNINKINAIDALVETRNPRILNVLCEIADDQKTSLKVRAIVIWQLINCLAGLPEKTVSVNKEFENLQNLIGVPFTSELTLLQKQRELPSLKINQERKDIIIHNLISILKIEKSDQIRALVARAGIYSAKESIVILSRVLREDTSPWVRAWCATSLLAIGGDEALKAIEVAKNTEKNAEVLLVLEGKAKPFAPWDGIPKNSILQKSNDMPSNAP